MIIENLFCSLLTAYCSLKFGAKFKAESRRFNPRNTAKSFLFSFEILPGFADFLLE